MKRKNYAYVIFDADGTLFDYEKTEVWALEASFRDAGLRFDSGEHLLPYRDINRELWEQFEKGLVSASALRVDRFKRFFDVLGIVADPSAVAQSYVAHLADSAFLFEGVEALLAYLRPKYKIGIVTNGLKEVQRSRFAKTIIGKFVDCIIVSDEVGVQKPEPGIFDYALDAADHRERSTVLMIGDSLTSDIKGGVLSGLDTCWFNPDGKPNNSGILPTFEIRSLSELKKIL